ncbi:MAG: hypothetical protein M3Y33_06565 [Actinomycetota bacterium]|nr:hypothetical protein [Actinomycetota bacterium]
MAGSSPAGEAPFPVAVPLDGKPSPAGRRYVLIRELKAAGPSKLKGPRDDLNAVAQHDAAMAEGSRGGWQRAPARSRPSTSPRG